MASTSCGLGGAAGHVQGAVECKAAGENREQAEQVRLARLKQRVAPVEHFAQAAVARRHIAPGRDQQPGAVAAREAIVNLEHSATAQPAGGRTQPPSALRPLGVHSSARSPGCLRSQPRPTKCCKSATANGPARCSRRSDQSMQP